jgi:hypothetical protein
MECSLLFCTTQVQFIVEHIRLFIFVVTSLAGHSAHLYDYQSVT